MRPLFSFSWFLVLSLWCEFPTQAQTLKQTALRTESYFKRVRKVIPVSDKQAVHVAEFPAYATHQLTRNGFPWWGPEEKSPYHIDYRNSVPVAATGSALLGTAVLIRNNRQVLTTEEVNLFDRSQIWAFDRGATSNYSVSCARLSDATVVTSLGVPLLYLTAKRSREDFSRIALMQFETGLVTGGMVMLTKMIADRPRPFVYNLNAPLDGKLTLNAKESFFSGHTAMTAAMSFFTATTFCQYYPESKWKPLVWTYAVAMPAVTGYLRYQAGMHYPTDILTGYAVGAAVGILVPKIHQKLAQRNKKPVLPAW
jgi:membrane-associated phospholipid phosphatase